MKTEIWFQLTSQSEPEKVIFLVNPTQEFIERYFINTYGGVYRWWI